MCQYWIAYTLGLITLSLQSVKAELFSGIDDEYFDGKLVGVLFGVICFIAIVSCICCRFCQQDQGMNF